MARRRNRRTIDAPDTPLDYIIPDPIKLDTGNMWYGPGSPRMVDRDYTDPFDSDGDGLGGNRGNSRERYLARKGVY